MNNLLTVCTNCHTPRNHKEGGALYNLKPKLHHYKGMAFMNSVKWQLYNKLKEEYPALQIKATNGVITKRVRKDRNIQKTHANDAYCIGCFYPLHRTPTVYYKKKRRNNRNRLLGKMEYQYRDCIHSHNLVVLRVLFLSLQLESLVLL